MLRTVLLASLAAVSGFTCLQAQSLGAPEWSNVPFNEKGKKPYVLHGGYCVNGTTYSFAEMAMNRHEYVGYIQPGSGPAISKPVVLPEENGYVPFTGFFLVGGKPCVLYTLLDKKANVVSAFVQVYTTSGFDPDGAPVKIGDIAFTKAYDRQGLLLDVLHSPDGSKVLFMYGSTQKDLTHVNLCWAMDSELNPLWTAAYSMPAQVSGFTWNFFLDNGHLYMRLEPEYNEDPKKDVQFWHHSGYKWYDANGGAIKEWDCTVPGMVGAFDGTPLMDRGQVVMAGLMVPEDKKDADEHATYALLKMDADFTPDRITSGDMTVKSFTYVNAMHDQVGNTFIYTYGDDEMSLLKLDAAGDKQWERQKPNGIRVGQAFGDKLYYLTEGSDATLDDLMEGKEPGKPSGHVFPILFTWDADGNTTAMRAFPEDAKCIELYGDDFSFNDCGCFTAESDDKQHPGLVRMCVEK